MRPPRPRKRCLSIGSPRKRGQMRVDIKKQLQGRSYRVKGIDLHPTEPWVLCSLFTGAVQIWDYESQTLLRTLDVSTAPVRACRFVARKNWIVVGGDDMQIRVFNSNTLEKVVQFEAHLDYIRALTVHPTLPYLLSAGDDMTIKLWNWDQNWRNIETYRGHTSYVLSLAVNPKDPHTFASASMDRSVKVWSFNSPQPNYTLMAHENKCINHVEYYPFADKPYLLTASDDRTIKIFDYQSKNCVATLTGHTHNVSFAVWHPQLPIIISGSEDSTIKIWNSRSYKLEQNLNYGLERAWCVCVKPNSNLVSMGFETGNVVLRIGSDEPTVSMDASGKLVWAKHLEAFSATIRPPKDAAADGDLGEEEGATQLTLQTKDLGAVEVQPSQLVHSPNGRFVAVVGDGEYIVYTALAWRNKMYGAAQDFAWGNDAAFYAVLTPQGDVQVFHNFSERPSTAAQMAVEYHATKIFGGALIGVASDEFVAFYDWETGAFVYRLDVDATQVVWADSGELVAIVTEEATYVLRFNRDLVADSLTGEETAAESGEGIDAAFEVVQEISERVRTAQWVGDCLIFTTHTNRLNYLVGAEVYTISHYDKDMYLLGYLPRDNAIYLCDKDVHVISQKLSLAVVEFQTVVVRGDVEYATTDLLPQVPIEDRSRVARFLESQGLLELAFDVTRDPDHRFDLALSLGRFDDAQKIASSQDSAAKFRILGDRYLANWDVKQATSCFERSADLDTLLLIHTSTGDKPALKYLAKRAVDEGKYNLAFNALWFVGDVEGAADLLNRSGRSAEAALLSLTYGGDVQGNVTKWKESLDKAGRGAIAKLICDPESNPERFPANVGAKTSVRSQVNDGDLLDIPDEATPEAAPTENGNVQQPLKDTTNDATGSKDSTKAADKDEIDREEQELEPVQGEEVTEATVGNPGTEETLDEAAENV